MLTTKIYKTANLVVKIAIILVATVFLYNQLFAENTVSELYFNLENLVSKRRFLFFALAALALMPLNWTIEALKWKLVASRKEEITLATALKAIFAGATISSISPNRTGEFLGRVFVLKKHSFWEGVLITVVGSYAQTFATFFFGINSAYILWLPFSLSFDTLTIYLIHSIFILSWVFFISGLLFYYRISIVQLFVPQKWIKVHKVLRVIADISNNTLTKVLTYSLIRYLVFTTQFILLLIGADIEIGVFHMAMLVAVMFVINTIRPSIALLEVGLRGWTAAVVFEFYYKIVLGYDWYPSVEVIAATGVIWLINIVLPSIIGLVFINELRFFNRENGV